MTTHNTEAYREFARQISALPNVTVSAAGGSTIRIQGEKDLSPVVNITNLPSGDVKLVVGGCTLVSTKELRDVHLQLTKCTIMDLTVAQSTVILRGSVTIQKYHAVDTHTVFHDKKGVPITIVGEGSSKISGSLGATYQCTIMNMHKAGALNPWMEVNNTSISLNYSRLHLLCTRIHYLANVDYVIHGHWGGTLSKFVEHCKDVGVEQDLADRIFALLDVERDRVKFQGPHQARDNRKIVPTTIKKPKRGL